MNRLSFISYAISFLRRDLFVTLAHTILFSVLFYFFTFSLYIQNVIDTLPQKNPYGLLKISANLSFLLCIIMVIFVSFIKILLKRNEIGIMMAVGGNRNGLVSLVSLEAILGLFPGYIVAMVIFSFYLPVELPIQPDSMTVSLSAIKAFLYSVLTTIAISIPGTYMASFVDPYQFIKRQK